jgi:hypothetical protein
MFLFAVSSTVSHGGSLKDLRKGFLKHMMRRIIRTFLIYSSFHVVGAD